MAVIKPTVTDISGKGTVYKIVWTPLANGDTGTPASIEQFESADVQVAGTFGSGGTISVRGSSDGTNYDICTDPQGNAITKTAQASEKIAETPAFIQPVVSAGDGTTALTATIVVRKSNPERQ